MSVEMQNYPFRSGKWLAFASEIPFFGLPVCHFCSVVGNGLVKEEAQEGDQRSDADHRNDSSNAWHLKKKEDTYYIDFKYIVHEGGRVLTY